MLEHAMMNFALGGAAWVLWLLVILSVACVFIAVERAVYLFANSSPTGAYQAAISSFLRGGDRSTLQGALASMKGIEARVIQAGLSAESPDAAHDAMAGTIAFEKLRMERGLIVIGTVAGNAPFVGLFGTVLGIIKAFHDLSAENAGSANVVMAGISEALVATAVGLLVAIPAVVMFNYFQRRIKDQVGRLESVGQLVLSRLRAGQAA
jgi:biopolymer transport protein ExbB